MIASIGAWRQRIRNPSIPLAVLMALVLIAIPVAVFGPGIWRHGSQGLAETRRLHTPEFAPPPGTWVRPWLVRKATAMLEAKQPHEWRIADFTRGPCSPENTVQLPTREFQAAIEQSCAELNRIQLTYAINCAETNRCAIPEQARSDIRAVVRLLDSAFAEAGQVAPVEEQPFN